MGGIATINDVLEFIMAGATDIAIGIANFNNHFVMPEIISELSKYMKENNVETLDEIRYRNKLAFFHISIYSYISP